MKENISVEAGKCCTHWLNQTFRSVIRQVLFLRGRQILPHLGKQLFAARRAMSGENSCALALPKRIENWSLTSLQQRLVKTGGRLVKHARYYWLLLAEGHLTRRWFGTMVRRIAALPVESG